jgi:LPS O-antigen subunit length determinant protein (WzzB/FepE family)
MWKSKKVILITLLAVTIVAVSAAGIAAAQEDETEGVNPCEARYVAMMDRVCEIYETNTGVSLDAEQLQEAFAQARRAMFMEAMESYMQRLVDEGVITQGEADEYVEWWQAKPDIVMPGPSGRSLEFGDFGVRMRCGPGFNP